MTRSFTLIELLIVVAIIGILAAIAVPNFLNAQTKAKLARVQSDFQGVRTALESYQIDNNSYPHDGWRGFIRRPNGWIGLSSPISYINPAQLIDPFKAKFIKVNDMDKEVGDALYELGSGNHKADKNNTYPFNDWMLISLGPDSGLGINYADDSYVMANYPFCQYLTRYQVTNGLISNGDIHLFKGGEPAREVQLVDDKPWKQ